MKFFCGAGRIFALITGTLILVPIIIFLKLATGSVRWTRLWHGMACRILGIRVHYDGVPRDRGDTPTLFVVNHLSYLDIVVLGAYMDGIFVAKSEVAHWPVFGFLSKIQNTIFIRRTRQAMAESERMIADVLRAGHNIILFAEGTSTDGRGVLPFKAGLLQAAYDPGLNIMVQPAAIVLESAGGRGADDQAARDRYAWWRKEDTLAPHLWAFACAGGAQITIRYQAPLDPKAYADRKALAAAATASVAAAL